MVGSVYSIEQQVIWSFIAARNIYTIYKDGVEIGTLEKFHETKPSIEVSDFLGVCAIASKSLLFYETWRINYVRECELQPQILAMFTGAKHIEELRAEQRN